MTFCGTEPGRFFAWVAAALFFLFDLFARLSINVVTTSLERDFGTTASVVASGFGASFFAAYAATQIPQGLALDRFGPRKVLALSCAATAAGGVIFATADSIWIAILGRVVAGVGAGGAWLATSSSST
jgi:MFS family permease